MKNMKIGTRFGLLLIVALTAIVLISIIGIMGISRLSSIYDSRAAIAASNDYRQRFTTAYNEALHVLNNLDDQENLLEFNRLRDSAALMERTMRESMDHHEDRIHAARNNANNSFGTFRNIIIIVVVSSAIILIFIMRSASGSITAPIKRLTEIANNLSQGRWGSISQAEEGGELQSLEASVIALNDQLVKWQSDLTTLIDKHTSGDTDAVLYDNAYAGAYRDIARDLNTLLNFSYSNNC